MIDFLIVIYDKMKLFKITLLLLTSLMIVACGKHPAKYYKSHPEALQKVIEQCNTEVTYSKYCNDIFAIAKAINILILELQTDPQTFGEKIIALQQNNSNKKNAQELAMRMAIVGWLEAPRH